MTSLIYDLSAPKKPTNLTVNSDLLEKAKQRKINISSVLESALAEELRSQTQEEWKRENEEAMANSNRKVKELGLFSDGLRSF